MKEDIKVAIGLMSGTSIDGIDISLIKSDGHKIIQGRLNGYYPYSSEDKKILRALINSKIRSLEEIKDAELLVTKRHIEVVGDFIKKNKLKIKDIDVIGFHGHTIKHDPEKSITWQIGEGQMLASSVGIDVVSDFRKRDVISGGQGAPLVPIYHHAIFKNHQKPVIILNIGGVSNITYLEDDKKENIVACDICFGNAPMDDLVHQYRGQDYDHNGDIAKNGEINYELAKTILMQDYFKKDPPKSLDRNHFSQLLNQELLTHFNDIKLEDILKTICYIIAKSLKDIINSLSQPTREVIVCGGGRHNVAIMQTLHDICNIKVTDIDDCGFDGSAIEAQAFAFLAIRNLKNLPITFSKTTGIKSVVESVGGVLHKA